MLLSLNSLIKQYGINISGIIHVGGHIEEIIGMIFGNFIVKCRNFYVKSF